MKWNSTKKLTQLFAGALGAVMLCTTGVMAAEPAPNPRITYDAYESVLDDDEPIGGVAYEISSMFYYAPPYYKGSVWIIADQRVPAGYMSAQSTIYNEDKSLIKSSHMSSNTSSINFHYQETPELVTNETLLYVSGSYEILSGTGRVVSGDVNTIEYYDGSFSVVRPRSLMEEDGITEYPVNADGLTYGSLLYANEIGEEPDLISAVGTDGTAGYILREDFSPELYTQAAVLAWQAALAEDDKIPLYDLEGNQIGEYAMGAPQVELETSDIPAKDAKLRQLEAVTPTLKTADLASVQDYQLPEGVRQSLEDGLVNGQYPTNADGETYGALWSRYVVGYEPDLIAVVGNEGEDGYVYAREYRRALAADGATILEVYDLDGTVVDQFTVGE